MAGSSGLFCSRSCTARFTVTPTHQNNAPFIGRTEELRWLLQQLTSEAGITLALCGPGGMGKTALAAEALTLLSEQAGWLERFPGGIFYHSFYSSPSLDVAFEELARTYGEESGADPRRAAMRALSRRRAILVFDGL
jgi:predicted ATPase